MKKQLIIFLQVLFTSSFLFSQNINQEYVFSEDRFIRFNSSINVDDVTYMAGSIESCYSGAVAALDNNNNILFHEFVSGGYYQIDDLTFRHTDSLIIGSAFWQGSDDFPTDNDGPYVFGMDLEGNVVFQNLLSDLVEVDLGGVGIYNVDIVMNTFSNEDEIIIAFNNELIWLDSIGNVLDSIELEIQDNIKDVDRINNNLLLAYSQNDFMLMNHAGVMEDSFVLNGISDVYYDDENIYVLLGNELMIYEIDSGNITYENNYTSFINDSRGIVGNSTSLFIYNKSSTQDDGGVDKVIQLNKNDFSFTNDFVFNKEETRINEVLSTENDLQIIGIENNFQPFIKSKPINESLVFGMEDVAIVEMNILDSLNVIDSFPAGPTWVYEVEYIYVNYEFTVENSGADTIYNFSVLSNSFGGFNCARFRKHTHYDNVVIPPDSSLTFIDSIRTYVFIHVNIPNQWNAFLSLNIYAPNHKFDSDFTNNTLSNDIIVLDNDNIISFISSWNIFPNPAQDFIHLNATLKENTKNISISIYDSQGRKIKTKNIQTQAETINEQIQVEDLPNGIYWLGITNGNKIEGKSFIIIR